MFVLFLITRFLTFSCFLHLSLAICQGLVEIWADEEIQRQLSAMGRKQNIWENIAAKLNDNGNKRTASQCKAKIRMHA